MIIDFLKIHGAGNSFVFISNLSAQLQPLLEKNFNADYPNLQAKSGKNAQHSKQPATAKKRRGKGIDVLGKFAKKVCSPQFGIGADGLVLVETPSPRVSADFKLVHYNADGSIAEYCGNALRCANSYVRSQRLVVKKESQNDISFETGAGVKTTRALCQQQIEVDMLKFSKKKPLKSPFTNVEKIEVGRRVYHCLSVGNPHAVCFVKDFNFAYDITAEKVQKKFPNGVNVEYVKTTDHENVVVRVVERGVGETLACGSGATAVACVVASDHLAEWAKKPNVSSSHFSILLTRGKNTPLNVTMRGGTLVLQIHEDKITMRGMATTISSGKIIENG